MRIGLRVAAMAAVSVAAVFAVAGPVGADETGRDYAEHVRMCQQHMGFSGTHNPGVMHQGFSGWDPTHVC